MTRFRPPIAALAATLLTLAACGGGGGGGGGSSGGGSSGGAGKGGLNAEVASFDLTVGDPARLLVGLVSNDQRFLVFGTVTLRFAYLGTKQDNQPGEYGEPVTGQ